MQANERNVLIGVGLLLLIAMMRRQQATTVQQAYLGGPTREATTQDTQYPSVAAPRSRNYGCRC